MKTKTTPAPPQEGNVKPKRAKKPKKEEEKELSIFDADALKIQLNTIQSLPLQDIRIVHRVVRRIDTDNVDIVTWNRTPLLVVFEDYECILVKDEFGKGLLLRPIKGFTSVQMDTVLEDTEYKEGIIYRTETVYSKNYNNIVGLFNDYLGKNF